ncbi:glycosyltransferase family 2 protein [Candidatus Curtissbacteria bacterium]|nr:glycosyltransferase family 2 protein [Candidatus Curtissbacteria bacterium]
MIVIDDGSTDGSQEFLKKLKKKYPNIFRPIFHTKNQGYGGVLKDGFKNARYDLIFYTDGDGQYDVRELPLLCSLMTKDVNFVNGIKMERQDFAYRVIVGNFYALCMRWAFLLPIFDVDCDFRLIRKSLLEKFKLNSDSGSICVELVKKAQKSGAKFRQVSVHHYPRRYGESQFFKPMRLIKTFKELLPLWWKLMI